MAKKLFYKIGEVCRICGVAPHVLRYWETEFSVLSPSKNRAGQRIYRDRDVEIILAIKRLLYEEGYTISGANRKLAAAGRRALSEVPVSEQQEARRPSDLLEEIEAELAAILKILES